MHSVDKMDTEGNSKEEKLQLCNEGFVCEWVGRGVVNEGTK